MKRQAHASDVASLPPASTGVAGPMRAALDVGVQVLGRAGNLALGIVVTAVLARSLGRAGFGRWTTILLVGSLISALNDLGLTQVAVQRASMDDDPGWLGALATLRTVISIPGALASVAAVFALADSQAMLAAGLIVSAQILLAGPSALGTVFQVRVRNDLGIVILTVNSLLWTVAVIVIGASGGGLVPFAVALVAVAVLSTGLQVGVGLRTMRVPLRGTRRRWRELARVALPLSIGSLLIVAYSRIDALVVYADAGTVAAGLYAAAYRILDQAAFIPMSLVTTLMPIVSRTHSASPEKTGRLLALTLDLMTMASLPALAFALTAGGPALRLVYGAGFGAAGGALAVLMGAFVLICGGYAFGVFTLVLGLQRSFVRYAVIALVVNLAANLLLVPVYGYLAAAWITLVTEALAVIPIGWTIVRRLHVRLEVGRWARIALAASVAGLSVAGLRHVGVGVLGLMAACAVVHVAALFVLRALTVQEIRALLRREPLAVLGG